MATSIQPQPQGAPAPAAAPGGSRHADGTVTLPAMPTSPTAPAPLPNQGGQPQAQPQPTGPQTQQLPASAQPLGQIQPQPTQAAPSGLDANAVLSGPNVPPALQNMKVGDALAVFEQMRQFAANLQQQNQQLTQRLQSAGPQPQTPGQAQAAGQPPAAAAPAAFDWKSPDASIARVVEGVLARVLPQILAPVTAPLAQQGVNNAKAQIQTEIGAQRWAMVGPMIEQQLANADPQMASNPELWRTAVYVAEGRMREMQRRPTLPQPPAFGLQPQIPQQPPNLNSFFTEAPAGQAASPIGLSPAQQQVARLFGYSNDQYAAAAGINQPLNGGFQP